MKFTVSPFYFQEGIGIVSKAAGSDTSLQFPNAILLTAKDGTLTMQTTDGKVSISHKLSVNVDEEGSCVVPCRLITNICKVLPDLPITVATEGEAEVTLDCGEYHYDIHSRSATDFPEFPEIDTLHKIELSRDKLSTIVNAAKLFAAKDNPGQPVLTGINLTVKSDCCQFGATDSYRALLLTLPNDSEIDAEFDATIPAKTFSDALNNPTSDEKTCIIVGANLTSITVGNTAYVTRNYEKKFPQLDQLFTNPTNTICRVNKSAFDNAVKRVAVILNTPMAVPMTLNAEEQIIALRGEDKNAGVATGSANADIEGETVTIGFNTRYLLDAVAAMFGDEILLKNDSAATPLLIECNEDVEARALIMPMRF